MAKLAFQVIPGGYLGPANNQTVERMQKLKLGEILIGDFKKPRNYENHKRFFALMDIAYDAWEAMGMAELKNRDKMRGDLIILAGYYDTVFDIDGNLQVIPKSMSFSSMDEQEFGEMFSNVVQVVIDKILTNYTRKDVDDVIEEVIRF